MVSSYKNFQKVKVYGQGQSTIESYIFRTWDWNSNPERKKEKWNFPQLLGTAASLKTIIFQHSHHTSVERVAVVIGWEAVRTQSWSVPL
jgi:hypothetical protein